MEAKNCEDFIIGDEPCTFEEVCDTLTTSKSVSILWTELTEVAKRLGYPADKVIRLSRNLAHETYNSVLYDILMIWRGKESSNAKLHALMKILEYKKELKDCTDALRTKFCTSPHLEASSYVHGMSAFKSELGRKLGLRIDRPSDGLELVTIEEIPLVTKINNHSQKSESTVSNDAEMSKKKQMLKKIWICGVHLALLLAVGSLVWVLFVRESKLDNSNKDKTSKFMANNEVCNATVTTFAEYTSSMKNIPSNYKVHLIIHLTHPDDWPSSFTMPNVESIVCMTLDGPILLLSLFGILDQVSTHLKVLTLKDDPHEEFDLCSLYSNDQTLPHKVVELRALEKLHLKITGRCHRIYGLLLNHVLITNIDEFEFNYNAQHNDPLPLGLVKKICYSSGNSLQTLIFERYDFLVPTSQPCFQNYQFENIEPSGPFPAPPPDFDYDEIVSDEVSESAQLNLNVSTTRSIRQERNAHLPYEYLAKDSEYPRDLPKLPNVVHLILRSGFPKTMETPVLNYNIAHIINDKFPNLQKLEIEGILLPTQVLLDGIKPWRLNTALGSLIELKIGLEIDGPSFDLGALPTKLRRLNLYLFFSICRTLPPCSILDPNHVHQEDIPMVTRGKLRVKYDHHFVITSNCRRVSIELPYVITENNI